jgi:hypothetical protein
VDVGRTGPAGELEPHHHHPRDPEEDDVAAGDERVGRVEGRSSGVCSGQPSVANGHSALENQVSSTSGSRSQPSPSRRLGADVGLLAAVPDRDLVAPPQLARDAPGPDVLHPVEVDRLKRSGWKLASAVLTTSIAGLASSSIRMNHCSEISGSIRSPERCENGTVWV